MCLIHSSEGASRSSGRVTRLAVWAAVGLAVASGCARREKSTVFDAVAPDPGLSPTASVRNFEPASAVYENTATIAWSTRSPFVNRDTVKDRSRPVVEPFIFLGNLVALPVSVVCEPPFKNQHAWRTGGTPPTMVAVPPIDQVVVETEGAIIPALKPRIRFDRSAAETRKPAKAEPEEWGELVPIRTAKGIVLVKPEDVPPPIAASPGASAPASPAVSPPVSPATPAVVIETVPSSPPTPPK